MVLLPVNRITSSLSFFFAVGSCAKSLVACRLTYVMEMVVIVCELVIAVCTLVHCFNLQHSKGSSVDGASQHKSREAAQGFLSLTFTLAVLVVMAIGPEKIVRGARETWTRVSATSLGSRSVFGIMRRRSDFNRTMGVVPVSDNEAVGNQELADVT